MTLTGPLVRVVCRVMVYLIRNKTKWRLPRPSNGVGWGRIPPKSTGLKWFSSRGGTTNAHTHNDAFLCNGEQEGMDEDDGDDVAVAMDFSGGDQRGRLTLRP